MKERPHPTLFRAVPREITLNKLDSILPGGWLQLLRSWSVVVGRSGQCRIALQSRARALGRSRFRCPRLRTMRNRIRLRHRSWRRRVRDSGSCSHRTFWIEQVVVAWAETEANERSRVRNFFRLPAVIRLIAAHGVFGLLVPGPRRIPAQVMLADQRLLNRFGALWFDLLLTSGQLFARSFSGNAVLAAAQRCRRSGRFRAGRSGGMPWSGGVCCPGNSLCGGNPPRGSTICGAAGLRFRWGRLAHAGFLPNRGNVIRSHRLCEYSSGKN